MQRNDTGWPSLTNRVVSGCATRRPHTARRSPKRLNRSPVPKVTDPVPLVLPVIGWKLGGRGIRVT